MPMPKDKIVFVRLTKMQSKLIDQFVKESNRRSTDVGRLSRSDVIRQAIVDFLANKRPKDPTLLSTIFAEEEIDRAVGDQ